MYGYIPRIFLAVMCALLAACSAVSADRVVFKAPEDRRQDLREQPWRNNEYMVIAYHDVEDQSPDQRFLSVSTDHLRQHFSWLHENGYHPVSVDQILQAHAGGPALPEKAVLLSFDDGYRSFYTRVYPLLKAYGWTAVLAPVGKWLDAPPNQKVDFGGTPAERERFLEWKHVTEMAKSGLVEVGAHTQNMHYGAIANPQGNIQPVAAAHRYLQKEQRYETDEEFKQRFRQDVREISARITQYAGKKPRVWVWPYGRVSGLGLSILAEEGYVMALTLTDGVAHVDNLMSVPRYLVDNDPDIETFAGYMTAREDRESERVVHVDLDYVYDDDPVQMERNLGELVQRIADLKPRTVYLQAYADPAGDGLVRSVYFPNRHLPMRADLFNRAAWQIGSRAFANVYAWMPVLAVDIKEPVDRVLRWRPDGQAPDQDPGAYRRLSPYDPRTRQIMGELYEDLARSSIFYGLVFHDDAMLTDWEDASDSALRAYAQAGLPADIQALRADPETLRRWTRFKSRTLIELTDYLADKVKAIRGPQIATSRNMYAMPVLKPESEQWFAQNLDDFLKAYDWTAIMAMPRMEGVADKASTAWLNRLVDTVATHPEVLRRTIFEVQTMDWDKSTHKATPLSTDLIAHWLNALTVRGARHIGYYPDDFLQNHPDVDEIRPAITIDWHPVKRK